jgi:hypothetical protein
MQIREALRVSLILRRAAYLIEESPEAQYCAVTAIKQVGAGLGMPGMPSGS